MQKGLKKRPFTHGERTIEYSKAAPQADLSHKSERSCEVFSVSILFSQWKADLFPGQPRPIPHRFLLRQYGSKTVFSVFDQYTTEKGNLSSASTQIFQRVLLKKSNKPLFLRCQQGENMLYFFYQIPGGLLCLFICRS